MSNKNLKVYRIQFITQVQDMQFKVKFPCQVKMIWKRSNQSAQTTLVPLQNGIVRFNQSLKLYVNMYFDTNTNKFVEKKCMYSFLIVTEKGQKSAGSITYDLADFFNRRIYQVNQQFPLQKCPLPDTKIKMKIYYEQSTETGYDSMSRISTSEQLQLSTASIDINELQSHSSDNKSSSSISEQSKKSEEEAPTKQLSSQKDKQQTESNYDLLNQSDLGGNMIKDLNVNQDQSQKISQNIQSLNKITGKINDFVTRCSGNIKSQIQNLRQQNKTLQQNLSASKFQIDKLNKQKQDNKLTIMNMKKQMNNMKINYQSLIKSEADKLQQLTEKYKHTQKLCQELQKSMEQKGQYQNSYATQLKIGFEERQAKLKQKIDNLNNQLILTKKQKSQYELKINKLQSNADQLKNKQIESQQKIKIYQNKQAQRQRQLSDLRYRLENVYQQMLKSLGNIIK